MSAVCFDLGVGPTGTAVACTDYCSELQAPPRLRPPCRALTPRSTVGAGGRPGRKLHSGKKGE